MTELLQRLQRALPLVEDWIEDLHTRHLPQSIRASDIASPRLAAGLPTALLSAARFVPVETIPFPPVSSYGLPEFQVMADMPMAGITFKDLTSFILHTHRRLFTFTN